MQYVTHNIIIGNGEVPAVHTRHGIEWVLPGGKRTKSKAVAEHYAALLNNIISQNLKRYNRRIMRK